jgi:hypothetical protein
MSFEDCDEPVGVTDCGTFDAAELLEFGELLQFVFEFVVGGVDVLIVVFEIPI